MASGLICLTRAALSPRRARALRLRAGVLVGVTCARGQLPERPAERVAPLPDQDHPVVIVDRDDRNRTGVSHDLALSARPVDQGDVVLVEGQQPPSVDDPPGRLGLTEVLRGSSVAGSPCQ